MSEIPYWMALPRRVHADEGSVGGVTSGERSNRGAKTRARIVVQVNYLIGPARADLFDEVMNAMFEDAAQNAARAQFFWTASVVLAWEAQRDPEIRDVQTRRGELTTTC